jgi:hypothetical protein
MSKDIKLPQQRLPKTRKGKAWRKRVIDSVDSNWGRYNNITVRDGYLNKKINQNLYEGKTNKSDMGLYLNPFGIVGLNVNNDVGHHNIIVPKIDLLVGEEANRDFDYTVIVTNPDAVSDKQNAKRNYISDEITKIVMDDDIEESEVQKRIESLEKYAKYSFKDVKELTANRLLRHYSLEQNFTRIFTEGFKDALIMGEEIYECGVLDSEPYIKKVNPHKLYTVRDNTSSRIEDSDIIIIEDYWSPGKVLDVFYKELKPKDIDHISTAKDWSGEDGRYDPTIQPIILAGNSVDMDSSNLTNDIISLAEQNGYNENNGSAYIDDNGNIRVLKVLWRSQKLIKKVKYYDDNGTVQYKIRSEEYEIDETLGEEATNLWVNEWWEGTKIAYDIYVEMQPRKIQYNRMDSPSLGHPGIVGEIYNTNEGRAISMVERMKGYQYLYDAVWDRLTKALAKNLGKVMEVDMAKIPKNWDVGKWLYYATTMGIGLVDSFKEGNKGASTGKLAGNYNTTGKVLDLETGSYIQQHIELLAYIKMEMSELAGITKQREGQISNRETVGGVERSVMQSAHITEWWFLKHEDVKRRALGVFLETAKQALKGTTKKVQYILDDLSIEMLNIDGEEFSDADYGVLVTSDKHTKMFRQSMIENAQAALQNQLIKYSDLFTIYSSASLVEMRKTIEDSESKAEQERAVQAEQNAQQMQQQAQQAQAVLQQAADMEAAKLEIEQNKLLLAKYKIDIENGVNADKAIIDMEVSMADLEAKIAAAQDEVALKEKQHTETVRHNKKTEIIDNKKASQKPTQTKTSK